MSRIGDSPQRVTRRPEGLPRHLRLRRRKDIRRAQETGRRRRGRLLTVCVLPNELGHARLGLAVSRKVGNAVVRNRVKRRLRDVFRRLRPSLPGIDVVVLATPAAAGASYVDLAGALEGALIGPSKSG